MAPSPGIEMDHQHTAEAERSGSVSAAKTVLKWTLFAVVAFFVSKALVTRFQALAWDDIRFRPADAAASAFFVAAALLMHSLGLGLLLRSMRHGLSWLESTTLPWIALMGRYLPGKAAGLLGLIWLLVHRGVPKRVAAAAVLTRTGVVIVTGFVVAAPVTLAPQVRRAIPTAWVGCLFAAAVGAVCLHPAVFRAGANVLLAKLGRAPLEGKADPGPYGGAILAALAQWAFAGLGLLFLARAASGCSFRHALVMLPAMALAQTVGFLALFAPAGLGVREAVLLAVLGPVLGHDMTAVVTVAHRLLQTGVEAGMAAAGAVLLHARDRGRNSGEGGGNGAAVGQRTDA